MSIVNPKAIPFDYDDDPDRFRANVESVERYSVTGDVHESVAEWLASKQLEPILDIGCGEGRLVQFAQRRNLPIVALDKSFIMLQAFSEARVLADANCLPFPDCYFGAVVALYMLYHLAEPRNVLIESHRVLRPEGLFIACVPSRYNDPELASILPHSPMTFDAENGPEMTADYFEIIKTERWNAPLVYLPDQNALAKYLRGRGVSQVDIRKATSSIGVPLSITKRGALIYGRKSS
jgi:SAM-dependent methyltransferase